MAKTDQNSAIAEFAARLQQLDIPVKEIIRHRAIGAPPESDDIQLIIISDDFGKDLFVEGRKVLLAAWETDPRIVPSAVNPKDWQAAEQSPFLARARKTGETINLD